VQDRKTYPYVYHTEHGWIHTVGSDLDQFYFYDLAKETWWWINKDFYPYVYLFGAANGWFYYYAPFGTPGNRWFYELSTGRDIPESEM
jgi:hypothetical protein